MGHEHIFSLEAGDVEGDAPPIVQRPSRYAASCQRNKTQHIYILTEYMMF